MIAVVADTGPINYLLLINHIALLERFFDQVLIPHQVHRELLSDHAPERVRAWAANLPQWCEVCQTTALDLVELRGSIQVRKLQSNSLYKQATSAC